MQSSEEGELSEEEGELPSPGAEAATASKAEEDVAGTSGRAERPPGGRDDRSPPGRGGDRGNNPDQRERGDRDDYVDHMRGPPHYGSRAGDERGGRERDGSRDGRMSDRGGGGRSRSPGDRGSLSHWERERERADWADRRGRGPPPGYRDGPGDGRRREDWGGDPRGGGGGRDRGRHMQQGGGYRDGGDYYGNDGEAAATEVGILVAVGVTVTAEVHRWPWVEATAVSQVWAIGWVTTRPQLQA